MTPNSVSSEPGAGHTNGTDTFIQLNTNADPTVDGIIQVLGVHTVDAGWFSL
jgi:hypothetical protein